MSRQHYNTHWKRSDQLFCRQCEIDLDTFVMWKDGKVESKESEHAVERLMLSVITDDNSDLILFGKAQTYEAQSVAVTKHVVEFFKLYWSDPKYYINLPVPHACSMENEFDVSWNLIVVLHVDEEGAFFIEDNIDSVIDYPIDDFEHMKDIVEKVRILYDSAVKKSE